MKRLFCCAAALALGALTSGAAPLDSLQWVEASAYRVLGKGFADTESFYDRLPARIKEECREELWTLSTNSSGIAIRFRTDSPLIAAEWTLRQNTRMDHMTSVGIRGLDLYRLDEGVWRFVGVGRAAAGNRARKVIVSDMEPAMAEYMLYLPLYDGVSELRIGVEPQARIEMPADPSPRAKYSVVFYGTSITQGGCANRAGMCYTSILSRRLDFEAINLGFSGNARLDPCIAEAMAALDPTVYFLDFAPNCTAEMVAQGGERFIEILRAAHPTTPIVMADNYRFSTARFNRKSAADLDAKTVEMERLAARYKEDPNFYFIPAAEIAQGEGSVDGAHLTDLGFTAMADLYEPWLRRFIPAR